MSGTCDDPAKAEELKEFLESKKAGNAKANYSWDSEGLAIGSGDEEQNMLHEAAAKFFQWGVPLNLSENLDATEFNRLCVELTVPDEYTPETSVPLLKVIAMAVADIQFQATSLDVAEFRQGSTVRFVFPSINVAQSTARGLGKHIECIVRDACDSDNRTYEPQLENVIPKCTYKYETPSRALPMCGEPTVQPVALRRYDTDGKNGKVMLKFDAETTSGMSFSDWVKLGRTQGLGKKETLFNTDEFKLILDAKQTRSGPGGSGNRGMSAAVTGETETKTLSVTITPEEAQKVLDGFELEGVSVLTSDDTVVEINEDNVVVTGTPASVNMVEQLLKNVQPASAEGTTTDPGTGQPTSDS